VGLAATTARQTHSQRDLWTLGVLPVLALGALAGLLGIYWDIAWHIDIGCDTFFTLLHNFLYSSITVVLVMSHYGLLRDRRDTPSICAGATCGFTPACWSSLSARRSSSCSRRWTNFDIDFSAST
jgi:hypothetical protein